MCTAVERELVECENESIAITGIILVFGLCPIQQFIYPFLVCPCQFDRDNQNGIIHSPGNDWVSATRELL